MTEKQFNDLRVGMKVMDRTLTKEIRVIDISRSRGTINTGGTWRRYKEVRLAGLDEEQLTSLPPVTHYTFPIKALKRYPILDMVIVQTILRAGPDGFVGTVAHLEQATQMGSSPTSFCKIVNAMIRSGLIIREGLPRRVFRFQVDKEKAKDFLV